MSGKENMDKVNKSFQKDKEQDSSRRRFIKNTGMVVGGLAGGSLLGGSLTNQFKSEQATSSTEDNKTKVFTEARMFFTRYEDFIVLEQATERIYPEDDNGPGAIELGVPYFIDKQLASPWGMNADDYRLGPFEESDNSVGLSKLTRRDIFINGLRKMNQLSQEQFDNKTFDQVEEEEQIKILKEFEEDKVKMKGVSSESFFDLLRQSVLEGVYSDPLYGGNRNMEGWKMKEFPGVVPSYTDIIEKEKFIKMTPVSLTDYQQKS